MAFALLIIGAVLLISAVKGTTDGPNGLFALVQGDFTGQGNFIYWLAAILVIGALGYIPKLKPISVALLGLVIIVLFLKRGDPSTSLGGGIFAQLTTGLASTTTAKANTPAAPGFNQPGSVINDPLGSLGSLPSLTMPGPSLGPGANLGNLPAGTPPV